MSFILSFAPFGSSVSILLRIYAVYPYRLALIFTSTHHTIIQLTNIRLFNRSTSQLPLARQLLTSLTTSHSHLISLDDPEKLFDYRRKFESLYGSLEDEEILVASVDGVGGAEERLEGIRARVSLFWGWCLDFGGDGCIRFILGSGKGTCGVYAVCGSLGCCYWYWHFLYEWYCECECDREEWYDRSYY